MHKGGGNNMNGMRFDVKIDLLTIDCIRKWQLAKQKIFSKLSICRFQLTCDDDITVKHMRNSNNCGAVRSAKTKDKKCGILCN